MVAGLAVSAFAAGLAVAQTTQQTGRISQFENSNVKVWRSTILPNNPLPFHRHDHPRVIIALAGGTMTILEDKGQSEIHNWQTAKAYWLPANAPNTRYQDVNVGDTPIAVMVLELEKES
jgi:quercetin dioxygenase-like cupin family protein